MPEVNSPYDLFMAALGDILYVEEQLVGNVLPRLISQVGDDELRSVLEKHLAQTSRHIENVDRVFEVLGESPAPGVCLAFDGLAEGYESMVEKTSRHLSDMVGLGAAVRTANYEIAAYSTLRRMAKALREEEAVVLLEKNLMQEKESLQVFERIAMRISRQPSAQTA
jgi:ferritin-like metal-binding protein YciE